MSEAYVEVCSRCGMSWDAAKNFAGCWMCGCTTPKLATSSEADVMWKAFLRLRIAGRFAKPVREATVTTVEKTPVPAGV